MKILIRGGGVPFHNKGAEALVRTVQRELGMRLPEATFKTIVSAPEISYAYVAGLVPVRPGTPHKKEQKLSLSNVLRGEAWSLGISKLVRAASLEIASAGKVDAVIDVRGYAYGDTWPVRNLQIAAAWLEHCSAAKIPYVFMPQAWGTFKKSEIASWSRKLCSQADLLFSRDDESSRLLAELQGKPRETVRQAPDIVLRFRGASPACGAAVLAALGYTKERPLIAIVPNMRVYERTRGEGASNEYVKLLVAIADHCIESIGATVLIAPNEIKVPGAAGSDDRFICGIVQSRLKKPEHSIILRDYYPAETVKSIMGQSDFLIASRFHSLIFALEQGVPCMALGWSHKYRELLRGFGLEEHVVDHDRLERQSVLSLVEQAWQERDATRKKILAAVPAMQAEVDAIFDEVAALLGGKKR